MKKIVSYALTAAMLTMGTVPALAAENLVLSDTTRVNVDNTSEIIYAKATDAEYHSDSNYYMHFKTGGGWLEVNKPLTETAVAGGEYVITVVAKPVKGTVWFRVGWDDTGWLSSGQMDFAQDLGDGWYKYEKTVTLTADQSGFLFHNEGEAEFYIDSISLKPVGGDELVKDGGFDLVDYNADNGVITAQDTSVNVANTDTMFAKMLWEEKETDNTYSLNFKTNGDWLEVSQNFTAPLAAGKYTLTAYMKGNGAIWYYQNWGTEWAKFDMEYGQMQPNGWAKFTKEIDVDGDGDVSFLIHSEGAADLYIDDISLVDENGVNYIIDGGFEDVTVIGQEPEIPESELEFSDTTKVNVENTDTCFAKPSKEEYHGDSNYYMHFVTPGDWLEVSQNLTEAVVAGGEYVITVVAKPVKGTVWFRVGWDDAGWLSSGQIDLAQDLGDGWYKYVKTVTLAANQTNFLFHNDGDTECYIDSVSLVPVDGGENLLVNGDFDAVSYDAEADVITAKETTINVANTETVFAKMLWKAGEADNKYSMHFKAGAEDWLEVSQDFAAPLEAGQYILTAYAKPITGRVWFYVNWDGTGWMATHAADVIEKQPDGWTKYQKTITIDGVDDTKLLFHNEGAAEFYIDDISLVKVGSTQELMPDGGFGEVTIPGQEPDEPTVKYEISNPVFKGLTAEGKLQEGTVEVSVAVRNIAMGNNFEPIMFVALYNGTSLCDVSSLQKEVTQYADELIPADDFVLTIDVPEVTETSDYKLRIMYWDGLNTLEPLGEIDTLN